MGSIYSEKVRQVKKPRIGLLNVSTEDGKGNKLAQKAFALMQEAPLNFIGKVEARDILHGAADVVVTDSLSGNDALKKIEGTAEIMFSMLIKTLTSSIKTKLGAELIK